MAWRREPAISELIRQLDRYEELPHWDKMSREERLDLLEKGEWDAVQEQIKWCREDFTWAARNYFWITDNDGKDVLLDLWQAQYLILQLWYDLKSKGRPQKIYVIKGRQVGACLDPKTKVLTSDLRWREIGNINPGSDLLAVDEFAEPGVGHERHFRPARVVARKDVYEPAYEITMDNGTVLVCTADHRWLSRHRGATGTKWRSIRKTNQNRRSCLQVGDEIRHVVKPWCAEFSFEDGWMGGFFDGEGALCHNRGGGWACSVTQTAGASLERAKEYLEHRGYKFRVDTDDRGPGDISKLGSKPCYRIEVENLRSIFRLIGSIRPSRFINGNWWHGKSLPRPGPNGDGESAWHKIVSIIPLGRRRMIDLQTTTGTFIAEGFVSHNSVLVEAMIAWSTMFFRNTEALVVSVDEDHSSYLFRIMLHIYDHLPWWMKPETAEREEKYGIKFDRRKPELRSIRPGLNSNISVQYSTQLSGVGQGRKILAAHLSELTDWYDPDARKIIEGDLLHAIKESPRAFAFLETTGKEAGRYAHKLWRRCEQLSARDEAEWTPLFIPWFFEPSRRRSVTVEWLPKSPEIAMRERVRKEWVKCTTCGRFLSAAIYGASRDGTHCVFCKQGVLHEVLLSDEQMYWKEVKRRNAELTDVESVKEHKVELATTAEEAFQLRGFAVFDSTAQDLVEASIIDPDKVPGVKVGYFDQHGRFHGLDGTRPCIADDRSSAFRCYLESCNADHRADIDQFNVTIWEEPEEGAGYSVGVDIAEGIGLDYSVIFVNKYGKFGRPDEQVAIFRDNHTEPLDLAFYSVLMAKRYNEALLCMEYEGVGKGSADLTRHVYQYGNLYRWKHLDSTNVMSNKWHWYTKPDTRQKLWQTARKWIKSGSWVIRSKNFLAEMQSFQKDEDDSKRAEHGEGEHDDELFAGMISLYCAHESEQDERGIIKIPLVEERVAVPRFQMICLSCQGQHEESVTGGGPEVPYEWPADDPASSFQCPRCFSHRVIGKPLETHDPRGKVAEVGFNLDGSISLNAKAVMVSPGEMPMGLDDL